MSTKTDDFFQSKLFSPLSQPLSPLVLSPLVPIVSQLINADGNFDLVFSFVLPNIRVAKCYQKLSSCSSPSSSLFYLYVLTLFDFFLYSDFFSILIIWVNFSFPPVAAVSKCRSSHCSAGHPGLENYFLILKYFSPFFPRFISSLPIFCILLSLAGNCRH